MVTFPSHLKKLRSILRFDSKSWIVDFFTRFTCEKTPQNNFTHKNFSVENNYLFFVIIFDSKIKCQKCHLYEYLFPTDAARVAIAKYIAKAQKIWMHFSLSNSFNILMHIMSHPVPGIIMKNPLGRIFFLHTKLGTYRHCSRCQNPKDDFKTGGTWRQVGQWTLIMNIYDFFYST